MKVAYCKNCGNEIEEGALFCAKCGQRIDTVQAQSSVTNSANQTQNRGNKNLLLIIIGIAAVFLIVTVVFGILILGKLGDKDNGNNENNEQSKIKTEQSADNEEDDIAKADDEDIKDFDATGGSSSVDRAVRFPRLVEGYAEPKSDTSCWINIDDDTRAKLDALDNDYNKISWVVEYAFRSLPDVVVSFTINENCGVTYVFLAFTNVGDKAVSIDGTADIYDFDKNKLASGYPYIGMLQPGGTYMCPIACPGADENNIDVGYTELNMDFPVVKYGTYSATAIVGDATNSNVVTSISVENTGDKKVNMGQVTVLLLDEDGFPIANGYVFSAVSTDPGQKMESDVTIGILEEDVDKIRDTAIFASPYVTG